MLYLTRALLAERKPALRKFFSNSGNYFSRWAVKLAFNLTQREPLTIQRELGRSTLMWPCLDFDVALVLRQCDPDAVVVQSVLDSHCA